MTAALRLVRDTGGDDGDPPLQAWELIAHPCILTRRPLRVAKAHLNVNGR